MAPTCRCNCVVALSSSTDIGVDSLPLGVGVGNPQSKTHLESESESRSIVESDLNVVGVLFPILGTAGSDWAEADLAAAGATTSHLRAWFLVLLWPRHSLGDEFVKSPYVRLHSSRTWRLHGRLALTSFHIPPWRIDAWILRVHPHR